MSQASSNAFARPLRVELGPSRHIAAALAAAAALAVLAGLALPGPLHLGLCGVLACHFCHLYRCHARPLGGTAVAALCWHPQRGWRLRRRQGWCEARLLTPVFVTRHLVAARFAGPGWRRYRVIVTADRLPAADFRRLRVRLIQSAHGDRDRAQVPGPR